MKRVFRPFWGPRISGQVSQDLQGFQGFKGEVPQDFQNFENLVPQGLQDPRVPQSA